MAGKKVSTKKHLTSEQIERIAMDFHNKRPQRETSPEAKAFLKQYEKETRENEAKGYSVDFPMEIPDITDED